MYRNSVRVVGLVTSIVCCVVLASCGGSSGDGEDSSSGKDSSSAGPSSSAPTEPSLPDAIARAPFCDKVDMALVKGLLGTVTATSAGKPGDKFQLPDGEHVRTLYNCYFAHKSGAINDDSVAMSISGKPTTAAEVQKNIDSFKPFGSTCTTLKVTFGTPSIARACDRPKTETQVEGHEVNLQGLFGDTDFFCGVSFGQSKQSSEFADQTIKLCTATAIALGS